MKKADRLLKGFLTSKITIGAVAAIFAYVIPRGGIACPICGNKGVHPWEWGSIVGV